MPLRDLSPPPPKEPSVLARYGLSLGSIIVATVIREALLHVPHMRSLAQRSPLSFMYPAVMVSALFGGWGPGLVTAVLSFLVASIRFGQVDAATAIPLEQRVTLFSIVNVMILMICARVRSARHQMRGALLIEAESQRRIVNTLEHIADAFFAVDSAFCFTYVNRQCEKFYGRSREEMIGRGFFDVFPEHRGGPVEAGARKALAEQAPVHAEFFSPVVGRWVEGDVYPTPDGLSAYFRDVTDRHAAQDALRESEERYRKLVETAQEGICQVDANGRITYANPAFARMLAASPETVVGRLFVEFVEGELAAPIDRPAGGSVMALLQEIRLRRNDGSSFVAQISTSPMRHEAGGYLGELAVITDVTERRTIEGERQDLLRREQRARADAETANRRKDQFLAILSHELRTPLTPVIARLALLKRETGMSAGARSGLEMIRRNVELEARLIDDLLDITRLARGQLKLQLEAVDVHEKLRDALAIYEDDIARRKLKIDLRLVAGQHFVRGDGTRLQQVFWNLVSNAVKYTPEGGTITVRSENLPGTMSPSHASGPSPFPKLRLQVSDSGIGIEPSVMSRIFDPFEQGEQSLTRKYGGLGLGLSISRSLMQMHGGTLVAESEGLGRGATFTVDFPTTTPPAAPAPTPPAEEKPEALAQRILLVDDNEDTLRVMARLLRLGGHKVITADSLGTALNAALQPFDLLITDIGLPDGTGWDLMSQLRQRGPVRGIAVSGFSMDDDIRRSESVGFIEHLAKPINPDELDRAIQRAVVLPARNGDL